LIRKIFVRAGVAEHGQRRRTAPVNEGGMLASGAYPAEVRGFKSHPLHQYKEISRGPAWRRKQFFHVKVSSS